MPRSPLTSRADVIPTCALCNGTGVVTDSSGNPETCPICNGAGRVVMTARLERQLNAYRAQS